MYPVLFRIGPFSLHTYGVFMAIAFLSAIGLSLREARRVGEDPNKILDLCFYALITAIVGARTLYVLVSWPIFRDDPLEIFRIWHGGLVFYGGFIGAVIGALAGAGIAVLGSLMKFGTPAIACINLTDLAISIVSAIFLGCGLSIIGVLYPAWLAAKMQPVEAMRGRD